ncbi:Sas10 domain-containing protein [Chloropicon primus]|uniref:Sas10 C-terminal domain-containing protein n=1 Tax=Chloropicon primus TaxID=1764295 RepID=A0A5B8MLX7_9CHLO|nr:hypothetical protein A3770_05p39750 [Chloropicon primus]UPR00669.1 Sas10 domain-containing protein [Chloropicon primus]|eukprot:QDZ21457.1 hypothetical protein A3770_05p39750 [Chloropicon primus]
MGVGKRGGRRKADLDEGDEVEMFHRTREARKKKQAEGIKFSFGDDDEGESDESSSDESMSEEAILNVEDESESEESSEEDEEEKKRLHSKKLLKSMEAQRSLLQRDQRVSKGESYGSSDDEESDEESDDEDDEDVEVEEGAKWGRNKKTYYQRGDEVEDAEGDVEDDFDAREEEEAEARRMQSKQASRLAEEDFAFDEDESEDDEDDEGGRTAASGLSREDQLAVVEQDAPELSSLLSDLKSSLEEIKNVVKPALDAIKARRKGKKGSGKEAAIADALSTVKAKEGLSFIEAKYTLMLSYCSHIVFYLLMKCEGKSVSKHPLLSRLVEIRTYLEKIRPIEKKMNYQVQKLVAQATRKPGDSAGGEDPLKFRPNPKSLLGSAQGEEAEEEGLDGAYVPPKIAPMHYAEDDDLENDEDEDFEDPEKQARMKRRMLKAKSHEKKRALRNEYVQHLVSELGEQPEEIGTDGQTQAGSGSAFAKREEMRMKARGEQEEELFTRAPMTKMEKKRLQAAKRAGITGSTISILDDLGATDIADFAIEDGDDVEDGDGRGSSRARSEMDKYLEEKRRQKKKKEKKRALDPLHGIAVDSRRGGRSGDEDLATWSLGDRRAKHDSASAARKRARETIEMEADVYSDGLDDDVQEDFELYSGAKKRSDERKAMKNARRGQGTYTRPPLEEERVEGGAKRLINNEILKNRGLTPRRPKEMKNPRKKHRIKFQRALVRRRGQVPGERETRADAYGGEATGIKTRITKSVKL